MRKLKCVWKVNRDPRFDDLSGEFNETYFKQSYGFLTDIKLREKQVTATKVAIASHQRIVITEATAHCVLICSCLEYIQGINPSKEGRKMAFAIYINHTMYYHAFNWC